MIGLLLASLLGTNPASGPEAERLLQQPLRRSLLSLIESQPGIHASQLCRTAGEPWGTVQYHLALLNKTGMVTSIESGRERRFFPSEVDPHRARLLAILHQGRRGEIARFIRDHPGTRQVDVCQAVHVSRKTFRSSIEPLVEEGLVVERKGLQNHRYYPQPGLEEVLREAQPRADAAGAPTNLDPDGPGPGPAGALF